MVAALFAYFLNHDRRDSLTRRLIGHMARGAAGYGMDGGLLRLHPQLRQDEGIAFRRFAQG